MPASNERPEGAATLALALSEADAANLAAALTELRAARDRLHRVDALLSRLLAEERLRLPPKRAEAESSSPAARLPRNVSIKDNSGECFSLSEG